jgi:bisanhydrobacterioruberin hydratase
MTQTQSKYGIFNHNASRNSLFFLCLVYFSGAVGMLSPLRYWFISMTPASLLLSYFVLAGHQPEWTKGAKSYYLLAFLVGFWVEVLGINTGFPFGYYVYGSVLGPKVFGTPLLIGINWTIITYVSFSVTRRFFGALTQPILFALVAALIPTAIDVLIEPVAIHTGMWSWPTDGTPPLQNYLGWYAVSVILAFFYDKWLKDTQNKSDIWILALQVAFFVVL